MKKLVMLVSTLVMSGILFNTTAVAMDAQAHDEIVKTCEDEAEGMNDAMAYIQQCIEDRMAAMQEQTQEESQKAE